MTTQLKNDTSIQESLWVDFRHQMSITIQPLGTVEA